MNKTKIVLLYIGISLLCFNCSNDKPFDRVQEKAIVTDSLGEDYNTYCWIIKSYGERCFENTCGDQLKLIIAGGMGAPVLVCNISLYNSNFLIEKKKTKAGFYKDYIAEGVFQGQDFKPKWEKIKELLYNEHFFSKEYSVDEQNGGDQTFWLLEVELDCKKNAIARDFLGPEDLLLISKLAALLEINSYNGVPIDSLKHY